MAALLAVLWLAPSALANHSVTELVSTGPDAGGPYDAASRPPYGPPADAVLTSADGSHAFFETDDRLVGADIDKQVDVYERSGGVTTLISTGPNGGATGDDYLRADYAPDPAGPVLLAVSSDGSRVFFSTLERLSGEDQDNVSDIYERHGNATTLISTGPNSRAPRRPLRSAAYRPTARTSPFRRAKR